ncbi:MAG: hypothetical protein A3K03_01980 [Bdellovibrionales bacterium RIFOXYD1_FULL_44_7]|nr:MAG: hypothetical protein A3K03_01980 [Bdellovibrionales bacterium RIFOXYD1_FULL_44_7]
MLSNLCQKPVLNFCDSPRKVEELFWLISQSQLGRNTLASFLPLYRAKEISIEPFPAEIVRELEKVRLQSDPLGAVYVNDGVTATIYLDMKSEYGALAILLFHEIIHALDDNLNASGLKLLTRVQREKLILQSEILAFEKQYLLANELKEEFPALRLFLNARYPKSKILNQHLRAADIVELYQLKSA